jgi:hypothetical protein
MKVSAKNAKEDFSLMKTIVIIHVLAIHMQTTLVFLASQKLESQFILKHLHSPDVRIPVEGFSKTVGIILKDLVVILTAKKMEIAVRTTGSAKF